MWAYEQGEKEEPYVHASSYIEPMDLAASCWTAFLHIASFAFFAPFVRHRSVSCSLPCTLISSVVLVMERVSPTAYLGVLICVFVPFPALAAYSVEFKVRAISSTTDMVHDIEMRVGLRSGHSTGAEHLKGD
jgi:hypothetical protein